VVAQNDMTTHQPALCLGTYVVAMRLSLNPHEKQYMEPDVIWIDPPATPPRLFETEPP
jgi:hypothetical protein